MKDLPKQKITSEENINRSNNSNHSDMINIENMNPFNKNIIDKSIFNGINFNKDLPYDMNKDSIKNKESKINFTNINKSNESDDMKDNNNIILSIKEINSINNIPNFSNFNNDKENKNFFDENSNKNFVNRNYKSNQDKNLFNNILNYLEKNNQMIKSIKNVILSNNLSIIGSNINNNEFSENNKNNIFSDLNLDALNNLFDKNNYLNKNFKKTKFLNPSRINNLHNYKDNNLIQEKNNLLKFPFQNNNKNPYLDNYLGDLSSINTIQNDENNLFENLQTFNIEKYNNQNNNINYEILSKLLMNN